MNQKELAAKIGVSRPRVSQYIKRGILKRSVTRKGRKTDINYEIAKQELKENLDPGRHPKAKAKKGKKKVSPQEKDEVRKKAKIDGVDYQTAKTLTEQYNAALKKIQFDEKKGTLVNVEDVQRVVYEAGRQVKEHLMAMPDRIAPLVAAIDDSFECKKILASEINIALKDLADTIRKIT
jgi:hypothetical protein